MPALRNFVGCLSLIAASVCSDVHAQVYKGVELVQADLLSDTTTIAPAKPFTVGLRLKMAPRWHTYWQYSGDAGLPTRVAWTLPPGFKAGPIQWPTPEKIVSAGDIINYGYSEEVVLLTEITPPAEIPSGPIAIKAKADWLTCADLCIPGSKELELTLPPPDGNAAAESQTTLAKYRALLPRSDASLIPASAPKINAAGEAVFTVGAPKEIAAPDFFPLPETGVELGHPKVIANGTSLEIHVPIESDPKGGARFGGVLVTGAGGQRASWSFPSSIIWQKGATAATLKPSGASQTSVAVPQTPGGLWHFLFFGFIGGLILNVMPCVLPVISLKIFSFIKQANEAPDRIFKLGLAYAAGVFAWFLGFAALVVALKAGGREVGYAFHLQNPWFIVGLSAAVFVFALNLFGVFEFILPGAASGALNEASQHNEGYSGAFLQGMLATVLGSACTAPFFGAALGFAFSQNAPVIFAMFTAIALGMSLPFILLTSFPAWLRFVPRPGLWMERVKQATGFLMLATLLWLLSILGAMRGADAVVWTGLLLLSLGAACWIHGSFNTLIASSRTRAAALSAMALVLAAGGWLSVREIASSRLPRSSAGAVDFPGQLKTALQILGQPVFVDFTAAWCVNCKANERAVLDTAPVQRALKQANANFLTADWTNGEPGITALLKQFGRAGVPLYVIYPGDRTREPIVLPEILTQQLVIDGLKSATSPSSKVAFNDPNTSPP